MSSWSLVVRGLAALTLGAVALFLPVEALLGLVILFGAYALVNGILAIFAAMKRNVDGRGWLLVEGLAGIAAGIITFAVPGLTALWLTFIIAAWAIVTGGFEIAGAIRLRQYIRNEWLYVLCGVLAILFGVLVMMQPIAGALAITQLLGIYGILAGALLLGLSMQVRHVERSVAEREERRAA
jgi:uncharacterized membrane protein HdeD (DUF308 family)